MKTKQLLLKLKLVEGIGIKSEYRFYQWLITAFNKIPEEINLSAERITSVLHLSNKNAKTFINSFNSDKLNRELHHHLNYVKWFSILDDEYPLQLKEAYLPPIVLFYAGNLNILQTDLLGVVGARYNSNYSFYALRNILPNVVKNGVTIVSGLARGVDKLSHQAAMANEGNTIAVIGNGLDQYYPKSNESLQKQIGKDHLLISEYPVGSKPARYHFPERNRIIAGLVKSILVTEAKIRSGSLITANLALQNNRGVLAVPGRIDSDLSKGCNELISAGAKPALTSIDVLEEFYFLK
ncbi:DNA-processing protein DprA [Apilactobacillus bombintestini]|uniref:DNA-protecting protein DprA n=1 Tax=Apilactobacillus bombintestini TaxID=2419772 RepID=A0A387AT89_9LACO|nr:DNA-processing protein DprA [Apilactobacillus bombintestini]AYF92569.1 DNA-protecting protein DprA [Apilactobacillus bombintestini]